MGSGNVPDRSRIRRRYERAAGSYAAKARIEAEMAARLMERTEFMNLEPGRVLDGGCGVGGSFAALAERFPQALLTGGDFARGMLRTARAGAARALLAGIDLERLPFADGSFGVYWSNACLHLLPSPLRALREAHRVLEDEGLFIFSTFGPDTLKEVRSAFAGIDGAEHVLGFADMHDLGDELRRTGLADPVMETEELVVLYARPEDLADELRQSGASNAAAGARKALLGKGAWRRFLDSYRRAAGRADGKVGATFEIVLGHAWCRKGAQHEDSPGLSPIEFLRRG